MATSDELFALPKISIGGVGIFLNSVHTEKYDVDNEKAKLLIPITLK